jgi:hypothetical protein
MSVGSSPKLFSPKEVASRFAGSIVTTTVLLPSRAARRAMAALRVVFPTPPVPQVMM